MNAFDIIGELHTYATTNSYIFLTGNNFYQNYEANVATITAGKLILACDFNANPEFNLSKIKSISYPGFIMLGIKHDSGGTTANLDETFYQKYTTRLYSLMGSLASLITTFACTNELEDRKSVV